MAAASTTSKKSVKAWYFKAGEDKVLLIDYVPTYDNLRKLLNCETIDGQHIETDIGTFNIMYNDNGMYEDTEFNKPATQVLGKLPIRWGTMNGNYLVYCSKTGEYDEAADDIVRCDMPSISFKYWIHKCSTVLREAQRKREEHYKAMGMKTLYSGGGFTVSGC